jgi:hypothetical protein
MYKPKLLGVAIIATIALSAIASATASAALPEFLPGAAGTKFTGTGGPSTLATEKKGTFECKSDTASGELTTEKKLAIQTDDFKECKVLGIFGAHSLEDTEGIILVKSKLHLCYINKAKKEVGLLTELTPVHVEIAGKLLVVKGDQVAQITPVNVNTKEYKKVYKPGTQCEGLKETLEVSENEGAFEPASLTATFAVTFAVSETLDA